MTAFIFNKQIKKTTASFYAISFFISLKSGRNVTICFANTLIGSEILNQKTCSYNTKSLNVFDIIFVYPYFHCRVYRFSSISFMFAASVFM